MCGTESCLWDRAKSMTELSWKQKRRSRLRGWVTATPEKKYSMKISLFENDGTTQFLQATERVWWRRQHSKTRHQKLESKLRPRRKDTQLSDPLFLTDRWLVVHQPTANQPPAWFLFWFKFNYLFPHKQFFNDFIAKLYVIPEVSELSSRAISGRFKPIFCHSNKMRSM